MKKLETLQNDLFAPFKKDEISNLNKILGGGHTNQGSDYIGTTKDCDCRDYWGKVEEPYGKVIGKGTPIVENKSVSLQDELIDLIPVGKG